MLNVLSKFPHLQDIEQSKLEKLILDRSIFKSSYKKGTTLHEQGTKCNSFDLVLSGKLISYSLSENGSETVLFEFYKGSTIGANLLFGESNKYPMNIYCSENSTIVHLSKRAVNDLLRKHSFVMEFIKSMSLNSQGMNKRIAMYSQRTLRDNLMDYFTTLSNQVGSKTIYLPITKKQLADYLGVQRPSLFRELKKMKEEELIDIENRKIHLYFL